MDTIYQFSTEGLTSSTFEKYQQIHNKCSAMIWVVKDLGKIFDYFLFLGRLYLVILPIKV